MYHIPITDEKYRELLRDSRVANMIKHVFTEKANHYRGFTYEEVKLFCKLFCEEEEK